MVCFLEASSKEKGRPGGAYALQLVGLASRPSWGLALTPTCRSLQLELIISQAVGKGPKQFPESSVSLDRALGPWSSFSLCNPTPFLTLGQASKQGSPSTQPSQTSSKLGTTPAQPSHQLRRANGVVVILGRDTRPSLIIHPQPSSLARPPDFYTSIPCSAPRHFVFRHHFSSCSCPLAPARRATIRSPRITNLLVILHRVTRSLFLAASSAQPLSGNLKTHENRNCTLSPAACQPPNQPKASQTSHSSWQSFSPLVSSSGDSWRSLLW